MKGAALFAAIVGILNTITLNLCGQIPEESGRTLITNIAQAVSPFVALFLMRIYIKFDHPPELIRTESAIKAAIKTCRKNLKEDLSPDFKLQTQNTLEDLLLQLQRARVEHDKLNPYSPTLPHTDGQEGG